MENKNFYFNSVDGTIENVLDSFSNTEVHSYKTSSIPLAEFWMPKNKQFIKKVLKEIGVDEDEYESADKIFEYPVYSTKENKKIGRPSMTDLMIKTKEKQIAIEGKFTEELYDTIAKWLDIKSEVSVKKDVLEGWYSYIEDYCESSKWDKEIINQKVVYQFLHRTASACYKSEKPTLIYQLFYNVFDGESINHQKHIASEIQSFARDYLFFNKQKISFYIVFTPVLNMKEIEKNYCSEGNSLFVQMKKRNIYKFDEPIIFDCLNNKLQEIEFKEYNKIFYSDEEFINGYEDLWYETKHRNEDQKVYEERILKKDLIKNKDEAFCKSESAKRYNKDAGESFKKLNSNNKEEWRFLTEPGYKKYAVSSLGRVAFYKNQEYHIIFQDDYKDDGYLRLKPDDDYNVDRSIEVYKLIAMGFLGKKIGDGYDVHHKINDGYNNKPENLLLLTRNQHNAIHFAEETKKSIKLEQYFNDENN